LHLSIHKIFSNLKLFLLFLALGIAFLTLELFHLDEYGEHLSALKNQHLLIEKVITNNTADLKMASIEINGALSEIALSVKHSGEETFLDSILAPGSDQVSLMQTLSASSQNFQDSALFWIEAMPSARNAMHTRMMQSRTIYLRDIDRMVDYQIHLMSKIASTAKLTAVVLFIFIFIIFFLYRYRLNQIYHDIDQACALDLDGTKASVFTKEFDFVLKRLARKSSQITTSPALSHPISGLNNEKGLNTAYNAKKAGRATNTLFLCAFEIDHYTSLVNSLTKEDMATIFKKVGDMISMYEQPLDTIAHLENDRIVFFLSRNSKEIALNECDKIVQSIAESTFSTTKGPIKITLSAGFLLKAPVKSLDDIIEEGIKLIEKAKENGGNRIAQLRGRTDSYR
jgi:GGDEF domain-containing protein